MPRKSRQTAWSARSAARGALRWHHTAQGLCSSWRRITVKRGRQSSSMQMPVVAADGHGYRALLKPATGNLVAFPCKRAATKRCCGRPGCHATSSSDPQAVGRRLGHRLYVRPSRPRRCRKLDLHGHIYTGPLQAMSRDYACVIDFEIAMVNYIVRQQRERWR